MLDLSERREREPFIELVRSGAKDSDDPKLGLRRLVQPVLIGDPDRVADVRVDFKSEGLPGLGLGADLLGDGSIQLIRLPGHAAGQVGALLRLPGGGRQFLIADAAWTTRSIRENRPGHAATGLILDEARSTTETLSILHRLIEGDPSLDVVPSHCPERASRQHRAI